MLAYGDFATHEHTTLREAAVSSAIELHTTDSSEAASAWLDENDPCAILLGTASTSAQSLAIGTRAQKRHRKTPILALAREPSDLEFTGAFSWGADDVVAPDRVWSLTARLRALARVRKYSDLPPRGIAVVGELDQGRRVATARVLAIAGFDVLFAITPEDLRRYAGEPGVTLVEVCTELCPEPEALIEEAGAQGHAINFVVSAEPKRHADIAAHYDRAPHVRITDASSPPENVVFLANELAAGPIADKRASPRILYGTTVRFRPDGLEDDELGFSFNVSEGGLYVRTLAPPTEDIVWLELVPPRSTRRVRLVGQVAWRRPFGPNGNATVPPGFGLRIIDGAKLDLDRWREACERATPSSRRLSA